MILITGASGYLGSHITQELINEGMKVRGMVYNRKRALTESRLDYDALDWVEADLTRPDTLVPILDGIQAVVHTVAVAVEKGAQTYDRINFTGTVNLVDAVKSAGIKRFINISQLGADSNLPYRFLASKGKAQEYVSQSGLDWTAFKPSVIWGPQDEFANTFARLVPLTPLIFPIIGGAEAKFQPVWVGDVATSVGKALKDSNTIGQEYELGGPEVLTLEEIERRTLRSVGARRYFIPFPTPLIKFIVKLMEAVLPSPPVTSSLLDLLAVPNVTQDNHIFQFVQEPRPFIEEYTSEYMKEFRVTETLKGYFTS